MCLHLLFRQSKKLLREPVRIHPGGGSYGRFIFLKILLVMYWPCKHKERALTRNFEVVSLSFSLGVEKDIAETSSNSPWGWRLRMVGTLGFVDGVDAGVT